MFVLLFCSLIKHIYATTSIKKITPSWQELQHIILRNFGGLEEINPLLIFKKHLSKVYEIDEQVILHIYIKTSQLILFLSVYIVLQI